MPVNRIDNTKFIDAKDVGESGIFTLDMDDFIDGRCVKKSFFKANL